MEWEGRGSPNHSNLDFVKIYILDFTREMPWFPGEKTRKKMKRTVFVVGANWKNGWHFSRTCQRDPPNLPKFSPSTRFPRKFFLSARQKRASIKNRKMIAISLSPLSDRYWVTPKIVAQTMHSFPSCTGKYYAKKSIFFLLPPLSLAKKEEKWKEDFYRSLPSSRRKEKQIFLFFFYLRSCTHKHVWGEE